jgi:hypothetical protein
MRRLFREPQRDPELESALRRIEAASLPGDAEPLRRRILAAARPTLADLRAPAPRWWDWISQWVRVAIPVGLAASVAAGLIVRGSGDVSNLAGYSSAAGADSTLVLAAYSDPPAGGELAAGLIAPESGDWLLEQAVAQ